MSDPRTDRPAGRQVARRSRDGYSFALPSAGTCLRRPHFFQQRKKWGKERRQKLRFCTSSARYACSPLSVFPHVTGVFLIVVVPPTVPAQLSAAAACYYGKNYSFCCVAGYYILCPTGTPTHCGAPRRNGRDLMIAKNDQRTSPYPRCCQRQRRRDNFAPRRELLLSAVTKVAKSTGRNCVSALPQRAIPVHCYPRFPSRNRRFPDRCRSPDCASTAFRCRCPLLR